MLGFCRKAGRRAAALDVANHERKFDGNREAESFRLEGHARAGGGGDAESAGVGRADRGRDGGDFVFGLEGDYAEIFVLRELVENVGCGRDGIRAEEKRDARFIGRSDETHRERGVAADVAISTRRKFGRWNFVADLKRFGGFAVAVAGLHSKAIGGDELRLAFEFVLEVAEGGVHRAVVEPVAHAEGEEILAAVHALGVEAEFFESGAGELGELDGEEAVAVERMVLQRTDCDLRFAKVVLFEIVEVDDQDSVGAQIGQVHFERGGIHGD